MASQPRTFSHIPHVAAAEALVGELQSGMTIDARRLRAACEVAWARSAATGAWTMRDAYDALELAQALLVLAPDCPLLEGVPRSVCMRLDDFTQNLPVQSVRSEEQIAMQQFSTPLPLSFIAGLAASYGPGDTVLEPSAGNGLLAWPAARAKCSLALNEIDASRLASLERAFPGAAVTAFEAELIDDLLPPDVEPDVVIMNPPFARSVGRGPDRHAGARHLAAALSRLAPGGRLVAIMPENFTAHGMSRSIRDAVEATAVLRLDILVAPGAFARHGTGIPVRLVVFDKQGARGEPVTGCTDSLGELVDRVLAMPGRNSGDEPVRPQARAPALFGRPTAAPPVKPSPIRSISTAQPEPLTYEVLDEPRPAGEQVGIYLPYRPSRIRIAGAAPHPTPLVESLAMGSIAAPRPGYLPLLPKGLVDEGRLSEAQLETLVYAGTAFGRDLPGRFVATEAGCGLEPAPDGAGSAHRCGYFLGDGTGAGKGRQLAGIVLDQWLRGNRRHIWISKNEALLEDARRDWTALGGLALDIQPLSRWHLGARMVLDQGILFVTYPTLRSGRGDDTRLGQLVEWAGPAFEGVIAFDESHAMANAAGGEGSRGVVKGSEQGIAGVRLQNLLPRARIVYASATGASDINNLAYATRLGLWGPQTAFADRSQFVGSIRGGGIAAMELVARDLKALGLYASRALSFAGVEYDLLEHALTGEQMAIYDAYADAWAIIHQHLEAALEATRVVDAATGATLNPAARSAALSRFEGTKQRFFGQLLLSMKLPSLLAAIADDLASGLAVVVQLVSTGEAMLMRRLADAAADGSSDVIDPSPREHVIDYLTAAFPIRQMLVFTDAEGNTRSEPLNDDDGRPVHCQAALRTRDELIERLCALPRIVTALDALIERFGAECVAEVTGRSRRLIAGPDGTQKIENRPASANLREADAFMRGDKRILVFSDAGGTGRSYHACLSAPNQARRVHYLLEPGWRADAAIQGLGRTHRTRQASAPLFRPVTTDVRGERRFISTIARRLDSLGALTRGQRQTGGQNLFDPADNLESSYARDALLSWYRLLHAGKLTAISLGAFEEATGLRLEAEGGGLREDLPPIQRWLNRLLALRIAMQNAIFDEFAGLIEARVAAAREAGTLDLGVETIAVEQVAVRSDRILRTDPASGATTHLLQLELARRPRPLVLERVLAVRSTCRDAAPMINTRSGRAALRMPARSLLTDDGRAIARYQLLRPLDHQYLHCEALTETSWVPAGDETFARAWRDEAEAAAATMRHQTEHLATGLLLSVWDKLSEEHVQVVRITSADGRTLLGREVAPSDIARLGERLGLEIALGLDPADLARSVITSGRPLPVAAAEPLTLKRALVGGEQRLELAGVSAARLPWYKAQGCFTAIIRYQTRLFVPVDRAAEVLAKVGAVS
jgi:predicted RNA methylase